MRHFIVHMSVGHLLKSLSTCTSLSVRVITVLVDIFFLCKLFDN